MSKLSQEEVVRRIEALHPTLEVTGAHNWEHAATDRWVNPEQSA